MAGSQLLDTLIVGAGISGLVAARRCQERGHRILVLEKSKGLGGRMATRRDGDATYDHGAQFIKLSSAQILAQFPLEKISHLLHPWFSQGQDTHFAAKGGLSALGKSLAEGLPVQREVKALKLQIKDKTILVECENNLQFLSRKVILSCPLPQSLEILERSQFAFPQDLRQIAYAKALVGLFELSQDVSELAYESFDPLLSRVFSISNQQSKGLSKATAVTVTMNPTFSDRHFDSPEAEVLSQIEEELHTILKARGSEARITRGQLKKWRYSHPLGQYSQLHFALPDLPAVTLIGDAFGGGSILGAIRSAMSLEVGN